MYDGSKVVLAILSPVSFTIDTPYIGDSINGRWALSGPNHHNITSIIDDGTGTALVQIETNGAPDDGSYVLISGTGLYDGVQGPVNAPDPSETSFRLPADSYAGDATGGTWEPTDPPTLGVVTFYVLGF